MTIIHQLDLLLSFLKTHSSGIALTVLCICAATGIGLLLYRSHLEEKKAQRRTVKKRSTKYKSLIAYNNKWSFYPLDEELIIEGKSLSEKTDREQLLHTVVAENASKLFAQLCLADSNYEQSVLYEASLPDAMEETPKEAIRATGIGTKKFYAIENDLCERCRLKPHTRFTVAITAVDTKTDTEKTLERFDSDIIRQELYKQWKETIEQTSQRLQQERELNQKTRAVMETIQSSTPFRKICESYAEFKKYENTDLYIREIVSLFYDSFSNRFEQIQRNAKRRAEYYDQLTKIRRTNPEIIQKTGIPGNEYLKCEEQLFEDQRLVFPQETVECKTIVEYTSPKGRNAYRDQRIYNSYQIQRFFDDATENRKKAQQYERTKEFERSKVTNSLRYDVMKRDGFRCVLCGASASEGAKLHVDHIKPIAKGGRTEIRNLRTLCDRCNTGKRAKYDPDGIN